MTLLEQLQLGSAVASPIAAAFGAYMAVRVKLARLEVQQSELHRRCDENRDDIRRQSSRVDELAGLLR